MNGYWLKFTDGTSGYCEGERPRDAVKIAEKLTAKTVVVGDNEYAPKIDTLPYPAYPVIWQFNHPIFGKCPAFCYTPSQCHGETACPKRPSCAD
jgi:hypothetical protein